MPDYLGDDMRKAKDEKEEEKEIKGMRRIISFCIVVLSQGILLLYPSLQH